jgi:hypothetical protein
MKFEFDRSKNELLVSQREIAFVQIIEVIAGKGVLSPSEQSEISESIHVCCRIQKLYVLRSVCIE